jgi:hypothetical protein
VPQPTAPNELARLLWNSICEVKDCNIPQHCKGKRLSKTLRTDELSAVKHALVTKDIFALVENK